MDTMDGHDETLAELRARHDALVAERDRLRGFLHCIASLSGSPRSSAPGRDPIGLLESVLDDGMAAVGASDASLLAPDSSTGELVFVLIRGKSPRLDLLGQRVPPGHGVAAWAGEHRQPTIVNDARTDDRFYSEPDRRLQYQTRSLLAVPLVGDGQLLGVVEMVNRSDGRLFSTRNQTMLTLICRFAGELLAAELPESGLGGAGKATASGQSRHGQAAPLPETG